jgi:hypothetical protein
MGNGLIPYEKDALALPFASKPQRNGCSHEKPIERQEVAPNERLISSAVSTSLRMKRMPFAWILRRSGVDTAICSKQLARWTYGDWIAPAENRYG